MSSVQHMSILNTGKSMNTATKRHGGCHLDSPAPTPRDSRSCENLVEVCRAPANHAHGNRAHGNRLQDGGSHDAIQDDDSIQVSGESGNLYTGGYKYGPPPAVEEKMRRELKFFFMNPYEKFKAKGRKPWKLGVQLVKIVMVTVQLIIFGTSQFRQANFFEDNGKAFNNIFLKDWNPGYDSFAYPKTRQLYAIYLKDDFFQHLDYAVYRYSQLEKIAVGTYEFETNATTDARQMQICKKQFALMNVTNGKYDVNLTTHTACLTFSVSPSTNISMKEFLAQKDFQIGFDSLIDLTLTFSIRSLHVKDLETLSTTDCVRFNITILYDYSIHGGRISVSMFDDHSVFHCTDHITGDRQSRIFSYLVVAYDVSIMLLCCVSLTLCSRSLQRGRKLKKKTMKFFDRYYSRKLTSVEKLEFLNMWYIMIIISDIMTISGSIVKLLLELKVTADFDSCSLLLGTGCFLVWLGILRYLGFFPKYNIPIITLKSALPNCMRFIVCGLILYLAYGFCGWIVLGPYHHKFRSFNVAIECMYSLINGDDMFATFEEMSDKSTVVWLYSRVYLYSFISLFIYVVLSLFIALIMDTYETVKACHGRHRSHTHLEEFIDLCNDQPESGCYRRKKPKRKRSWKNLCHCQRTSSSSDESTPLLH